MSLWHDRYDGTLAPAADATPVGWPASREAAPPATALPAVAVAGQRAAEALVDARAHLAAALRLLTTPGADPHFAAGIACSDAIGRCEERLARLGYGELEGHDATMQPSSAVGESGGAQ